MADQDLERIKAILVGDIRDAVDELSKNFESDQFAERVADVVAEALQRRANKDDMVADVLAPTIDQAITGSIDQDPKKLAESLYPIMGPAIRKSISETLQQMLENFNQLLEESLSPRSLRWRFDAWRTGKSYSELVMLNTLEYRVEQVFLIHRETSLLIQHQLSDLADAKDPDMVSSMFSAIQDFVEDSFATDASNELNTLRLGDLTVVIQRGPAAILAAVVRGRVPENLRSEMIQLLESLHAKKRALITQYSGDPDDFLDIEPDVRHILQAETKEVVEEERKIPWLALVSLLLIGSAIGYWYWLGMQITDAQQQILNKLENEPGLIILEANQTRESLRAKLLADPDAANPETLARATDTFSVALTTQPFLSMEEEIVLRRATRVLGPPDTVKLKLTGNTLHAEGRAEINWLNSANQKWRHVNGVEAWDLSRLSTFDSAYDALIELIGEVERYTFEFEKGESEIDPDSQVFQSLALNLKQLVAQATASGRGIQVDVVGFTDATGTRQINRVIGRERAERVVRDLIASGVDPEVLTAYTSFEYELDPATATGGRETRLIVQLEETR